MPARSLVLVGIVMVCDGGGWAAIFIFATGRAPVGRPTAPDMRSNGGSRAWRSTTD